MPEPGEDDNPPLPPIIPEKPEEPEGGTEKPQTDNPPSIPEDTKGDIGKLWEDAENSRSPLVVDLDGDGKADGFKDGFEALKALATDAGLINGKDDNVLDENDLAVLEKDYGLKMKANGYNSEAQSLADLGITEINLAQTDSTTLTDDFDGNGNQLMQQEGATFILNGEEMEYADIWHSKKE